MVQRHDLRNDEWDRIEGLLPTGGRPGRPWRDHRQVISGMLWVLSTGAAWRDLPRRYGPWQSVYDRFNRWRSDGTLRRIFVSIRDEMDRQGLIDWDLWCIDGASVRASRAAAGGGKKGAPRNRRTTHSAIRVEGSERSSTF
jgi:transposase